MPTNQPCKIPDLFQRAELYPAQITDDIWRRSDKINAFNSTFNRSRSGQLLLFVSPSRFPRLQVGSRPAYVAGIAGGDYGDKNPDITPTSLPFHHDFPGLDVRLRQMRQKSKDPLMRMRARNNVAMYRSARQSGHAMQHMPVAIDRPSSMYIYACCTGAKMPCTVDWPMSDYDRGRY